MGMSLTSDWLRLPASENSTGSDWPLKFTYQIGHSMRPVHGN